MWQQWQVQHWWRQCNPWWTGWWPSWRDKCRYQVHLTRAHKKTVRVEGMIPSQREIGNNNAWKAATGAVAWTIIKKECWCVQLRNGSFLCQRVGSRGNRNAADGHLIRQMVGPVNVVSVEMEGVSSDALVDTGSMITAITVLWRSKLAAVPLRSPQDLIGVEGANDLKVRYLSFVEVLLQLQHGCGRSRADAQGASSNGVKYKVQCQGTRHHKHQHQVQPAWYIAFDSFRASTVSPIWPWSSWPVYRSNFQLQSLSRERGIRHSNPRWWWHFPYWKTDGPHKPGHCWWEPCTPWCWCACVHWRRQDEGMGWTLS